MKKILCLIVAMLMAFCMMTTVLADEVPSVGHSDGDYGYSDGSGDSDESGIPFLPVISGDGATGANGAADDEKAPNTGDENNIVLWGSVFALTLGAAVVLTATRKAKAEK